MTVSYRDTREKWLKNPKIRAEYDALEAEFALLESMIQARARAKLSQEEVAARMGTTQPTVARLESGHKPNLRSLERYAAATNSKLMITLVPNKKRKTKALA